MTQISKKWTTMDVKFLVDNYLTMTDQELGYTVYEIWEFDVEADFLTVKRKIARLLGN